MNVTFPVMVAGHPARCVHGWTTVNCDFCGRIIGSIARSGDEFTSLSLSTLSVVSIGIVIFKNS
jgi:hypothetical protein